MSKSPFMIRGHHLSIYAELASWRSDPANLARGTVEGILYDSEGKPDREAYAQDVVGSTSEEIGSVVGRYRAIFTRFVELERDDLVVVTTGERDHICQSCIVGNHCVDRGLEMSVDTDNGRLQVYEKDFGDMFAITAFKKLAAKLSSKGKIDPSLCSYTPMSPSQPTPTAVPILKSNMIKFETPIQANAGYVKAVLAHWGLAQTVRF